MKYLLGIDLGTSGTRSVLFDENGQVLAAKSAEYPLYQPHNGWAEQDPEDWWQAAIATISHVVGQSGVDPRKISALGISAAFICIRLTKMLRDDVLLHKMYTKATDEREALLWQKAGRQAFWVVVPGLVLAALAAGYWSATVCMTLLGAALFTAVTTKALRFYYMRKF